MTLLLALSAVLSASSINALAPATTTAARRAIPAATVLLSLADRTDVRKRKAEFAAVLRRCEADVGYAPLATAEFGPDPHYNATGVNHTPNNAKRLSADSQAAYRAGFCHLVTGDKRYAATAQRILDAWSGTLTKVTTKQGEGDINFNLPYMIAAASYVRGTNGWDGAAFGRFLRSTILPYSASDNPNNHGMWGVFMEASAAAYLGDETLLTKARDRWIEVFKGAAAPDGTLIREVERSGTTNWRGGPDKGAKGIAYTHYFLLPASMAAKVFADEGKPAWTTEGGKLLEAAFGRVAGWMLRPETFPFYASNNGKLEGVRAAAYFPLLLRYYRNADAETAVRQGDIGEGGFLLPQIFRGPEGGRTAKRAK